MLKKIIKAILKYPLILINRVYTYFYYKNSEANENYLVDDMFEGKNKVLVVAPHVDDETIGAGGALIKHRDNEDTISIVYVSDGGGSTTEHSREQLIEERKSEGMGVKDFLHGKSIYFLDEPDGSVNSNSEELISNLVKILEVENPSVIYTPFLIDGHTDHVETTKSIIKAVERWNSDFSSIYMYEVNCPIIPKLVNSICSIDKNTYDEKENMYKIFKSQWAMGFSVFSLLNRRKKLIVGESYGGEVFVKTNVESSIKAMEALRENGFLPEQFKQLSSEYNLLMAFRRNADLREKYSNIVGNTIIEEVAK
ncbi:PIG-L deacetylase family protein [Anaerosalibacter sp. Marseille-P3206]|uniref:PIG-L deacetylase family protein n=1 Tax=Anaerosalibacter sp. Marseille-P3206 TaxID=1871005 RepID=UPI00098672D4|nr:PIG-L family deacetylase [Anaerosalibacter sp. Marseille-P3206]